MGGVVAAGAAVVAAAAEGAGGGGGGGSSQAVAERATNADIANTVRESAMRRRYTKCAGAGRKNREMPPRFRRRESKLLDQNGIVACSLPLGPPSMRRFRGFVVVPALALGTLVSPARTFDLPLPGPAPRAPLPSLAGVGLADDASCAACHAEIAAEWQGSLHQRAFVNDYFQRSYAEEPSAFCRGCHAPQADPNDTSLGSLATPGPMSKAHRNGVGCTSCHGSALGIVGSRGRQDDGKGGHAVLADPRLATAAACEACHQFNFPGPHGSALGPMQDTLHEQARSPAASTPCQECHMPEVANAAGQSHRAHRFQVQGDPRVLSQAVLVDAAAFVGDNLTLTVRPGAIGHAFPTGDLFRQVEVRAVGLDASGKPSGPASSEAWRRTFEPKRVGSEVIPRAPKDDTRLVSQRTVSLPLSPQTRRARWQIVWQRMPASVAKRLGFELSQQEQVVMEGEVSR